MANQIAFLEDHVYPKRSIVEANKYVAVLLCYVDIEILPYNFMVYSNLSTPVYGIKGCKIATRSLLRVA